MPSRQAARWLAILLISSVTIPAYAETWLSVQAKSELEFIANYEGADAPGQFSRFDVVVKTDPETKNPVGITAAIDITSAGMGNAEIDEAISGPEWFDARAFPRALFRSTQVHVTAGAEYAAQGIVSIKGVDQPVTVPFHWNSDGNVARMAGSLELSRLDFGIGSGEWASDSTIGNTVVVRFRIELKTQ